MKDILLSLSSGLFEKEANYLDLIQARAILLNNYPTDPVDAVFFFGRSFFDAGKKDLFKVAAELIQNKEAGYIFIADSEGERVGETTPRTAWPGKTLWTDRLVRLGVGTDKIIYCPHPITGEVGFHTRTEADAFVGRAANMELNSAVVLTQPHQLIRAVLSVIKAINQQEVPIDVWSMFPPQTDWDKKVKGSQGLESKPRREHIPDEIDRIFKYQKNGQIATFNELFDYLARRDIL